MGSFTGFNGQTGVVRIPEQFFTEILPAIDDLDEMRVTLYCLWLVQAREGNLLYLTEVEILNDERFAISFSNDIEESDRQIRTALIRAVARGSLLMTKVSGEKTTEHTLYFANTERSRQAIKGLQSGAWKLDENLATSLTLSPRESIFSVYERNIGPLTPLLAENLSDLVDDYSEASVAEAISIAVRNNVRRLSYVEAILKRWRNEGRGDERGTPDDYRRFRNGKYGDEIET